MMKWSAVKSACESFRQRRALSLEERWAYMLIMVRDPFSGDWSVRNCALPSITMPCSLTRGAVALSTRIAVPTLVLCEVPIGIPSFQKEDPCQYSIPLAMC